MDARLVVITEDNGRSEVRNSVGKLEFEHPSRDERGARDMGGVVLGRVADIDQGNRRIGGESELEVVGGDGFGHSSYKLHDLFGRWPHRD